MTDITRDDLIEVGHAEVIEGGRRYMTRQKFDRLTREAGYVKADDSILTTLSGCELAGLTRIRTEALRALLTDECESCGGRGTLPPTKDEQRYGASGDDFHTCPDCGGRGWLPKDGVTIHRNASTGYETAMFPADWLEAEDEQ